MQSWSEADDEQLSYVFMKYSQTNEVGHKKHRRSNGDTAIFKQLSHRCLGINHSLYVKMENIKALHGKEKTS